MFLVCSVSMGENANVYRKQRKIKLNALSFRQNCVSRIANKTKNVSFIQ